MTKFLAQVLCLAILFHGIKGEVFNVEVNLSRLLFNNNILELTTPSGDIIYIRFAFPSDWISTLQQSGIMSYSWNGTYYSSSSSSSSSTNTGTNTYVSGTSGTGTSGTGTYVSGTSGTGTSQTGTSGTGTYVSGTSQTGTSGTGTYVSGTSQTGTSGTGTSQTGTSGTGTYVSGTSQTGTSGTYGTATSGTSGSSGTNVISSNAAQTGAVVETSNDVSVEQTATLTAEQQALLVKYGAAPQVGCEPNPCHAGRCSTAEDPYGWGWYCVCSSPAGGRQCQFANPCESDPCPEGTATCSRSLTKDRGRTCYDARWNIIE